MLFLLVYFDFNNRVVLIHSTCIICCVCFSILFSQIMETVEPWYVSKEIIPVIKVTHPVQCSQLNITLLSFMVALCNKADHIYFHPVICFFFFPRLISAVGDWMSTILPHMVWP